MATGVIGQLRRARASRIRALGRSWIFWPLLLVAGIASNGPSGWPSTWLWVAALVASGPVLSAAIHAFARRRRPARTPTRAEVAVLRHFRGRSSAEECPLP